MSDLDDVDSIREWFDQMLENGPVAFIKFFRMSASGEEHVLTVEGMKVDPKVVIKNIAAQLQLNADNYAGLQKYKGYVFGVSDDPLPQREHRAVRFFRFEGEGTDTDGDEADDDTIERHAMRFLVSETNLQNRHLHDKLLEACNNLSQKNETDIARLTARVQFLEAGRDALYIKERELLLREMEIQKEQSDMAGKDIVMKHADALLGQVLPTLTQKIMPALQPPETKALTEDPALKLIRSFTPEQLTKLQMAPFAPSIKARLSALVSAYMAGGIAPPGADAEWLEVISAIAKTPKSQDALVAIITEEQDALLTELVRRGQAATKVSAA